MEASPSPSLAKPPNAATRSAHSVNGSAGRPTTRSKPVAPASVVRNFLSLPSRLVHSYDDFITKNAGQVSQIESALRSLTYVIPGRFRDAEIASESIHSGVQLLSLYHDLLLQRAAISSSSSSSSSSPPANPPPAPARPTHTRYTTFWFQKSRLYRRVSLALQVVQYTQLLLEMAAKRRGDERLRWRLVVVIEAFKALCRLVLLRITRGRPLLTPTMPERQPLPVPGDDDDEDDGDEQQAPIAESHDPSRENGTALVGERNGRRAYHGGGGGGPSPHKQWYMPRTHSTLPSLPSNSDIGSYLLSRVLTADDIKPAPKLLRPLSGAAQTAEVLHILAPLVYAMALAHFSLRQQAKSPGARGRAAATWTPWLLGVALTLAARQLRDRSYSATALEREEWSRRAWSSGWWLMRGAAYDSVVKGLVERLRKRMPSFIGGIIEDYEYLWENYYFSTAD